MDNSRSIKKEAVAFNVCAMFKGTETPDELMRLFLSVQGLEFCVKNRFPTLEMWRSGYKEIASKYNIFIDAGDIRIANQPKVVLIGDTQAELVYDNSLQRHEVVVMHGAKAKIKASGYAVVFVTSADGEIERDITGNAKIL